MLPTNAQRIVVVIDLDHTLLHSISKHEKDGVSEDVVTFLKVRFRHFFLKLDDGYQATVILRPYALTFLRYLFMHPDVYDVVIWSAGESAYVEQIAEHLLRMTKTNSVRFPHDPAFKAVWTREHTLQIRGVPIKSLTVLSKCLNVSMDHIVFIDDNPDHHTYASNRNCNQILLDPFDAINAVVRSDAAMMAHPRLKDQRRGACDRTLLEVINTLPATTMHRKKRRHVSFTSTMTSSVPFVRKPNLAFSRTVPRLPAIRHI